MKSFVLVLLCCFLSIRCQMIFNWNCTENLKIYSPDRFFSGMKQKSMVLYKPKEGSKPFSLDVSIDLGDNVFCNVSKLISDDMHKADGSVFMEVFHGFPRILRGAGVFLYMMKDSNGNILDTVNIYQKSLSSLNDLIIFETDKPLYRPGEKLIARLIIIDAFKLLNIQSFENAKCENLTKYMRDPSKNFDKYNDETIYLSLKDSAGITMANWNGLSYQDALNIEYSLMSNCATGVWSFVLKYKGKYLRETFDVRQYILPRFLASIKAIKTPNYFTNINDTSVEDNLLKLSICGKYTNGIPIKGSVKGLACNCDYDIDRCTQNDENQCIVFNETLKQDCKKIKLDVGKWRNGNYIYQKIRIKAEFEEADTGIKVNKSILVKTYEDYFTKRINNYVAFYNTPSKLKLTYPLEKSTTYYMAFYDGYDKYINFLAKIFHDQKELNLPPFNASQNVKLYEVARNGTLKEISDEYLVVITPSVDSYFHVTPNTSLIFEGKTCPENYEIVLLAKANLDGKTVTLFSQNTANIIEQKFKLVEDKCVDRDDMYGHYKCNTDGSISCIEGFYGSNCLKIKCKCEQGCFCSNSMECVCDEKFMKQRPSEEVDERNIFLYKIKIKIDENFGQEFKGIFYYLNESNELVITPIIIKNLYSCTNKVIKETSNSIDVKNDGFFFNKKEVRPGENFTLNIQYKSSEPAEATNAINSQPISSLCFIRAYDELLKNFVIKNKEFAYNLNKYLRDLKMLYLEENSSDLSYWDAPKYANLFMATGCLIYKVNIKPLGGYNSPNFISNIKIRDYFPESWFFKAEMVSVLNTEKSIRGLRLDLKVPDSVTQWNIAAYCPTEYDGIWIPRKSLQMNVVQPFHIEMNLPVKATRGESFKLPVTIVFEDENLIKANSLITISAHFDDDEWEINNGYKHQICMLSGTRSFVELFELKPKKVGNLNLTLLATAAIDNSLCSPDVSKRQSKQVLNDGIRRSIRVVPEGIVKEESNTKIVCLENKKETISKTILRIPKQNIVDESLKAYVGVTGDSMSLASENIEKLIRKPYGCGEQNMISVVPSVAIASYLLSSKKPKDEKELKLYDQMLTKAKRYIHDGYQRELTYRLKDGSFSAFGERDKNGSTWLTSFVIQVFSQASSILKDEWKVSSTKMFVGAIMYIRSVMDDTHCFLERGKLFDRELKSRANDKNTSGISSIIQVIHSLCSVHCSPIFKSDEDMKSSLLEDISKSFKCLQTKLKSITLFHQDTWLVSTHYTRLLTQLKMLDLVDDSEIDSIANKLEEKANYDTKSDMKWWGDEKLPVETNIKITSNALLALEKRINKVQILPIIRWILSKQKKSGGFYSTQDTILAIEALSKYTMEAFDSSVIVKAKINDKRDSKSTVFVLDSNARKAYNIQEAILIDGEIPDQIAFEQELSATEPTSGCLQFITSIIYYEKIETPVISASSVSFKTEVKVDQEITDSFKCKNPKIQICTKLLEKGQTTGMLLMTIELPTGLLINKNKAEMQVSDADNGPKRVEFDDATGSFYVYFNGFTEFDTLPRCVSVEAEQFIYVEDLRLGIATTQDYYTTKDVDSVNYAISSCEEHWRKDIEEINKKRGKRSPSSCVCNIPTELNELRISIIKQRICQKTAKYQMLTSDDLAITEFEDKDILNKCQCIKSFPAFIYQQSETDTLEVYSDSANLEKLLNTLSKPCL